MINWPEKCGYTDADSYTVNEHNPYEELEKADNTQPQRNGKADWRHWSHHKQINFINSLITLMWHALKKTQIYVRQSLS